MLKEATAKDHSSKEKISLRGTYELMRHQKKQNETKS